jgi:hypothetical protein
MTGCRWRIFLGNGKEKRRKWNGECEVMIVKDLTPEIDMLVDSGGTLK